MQHGGLDRSVQFLRYKTVDDGFGRQETWEAAGEPQRAQKADVSDAETWRAMEVGATVTARFTLRWTEFVAGFGPRDRLTCDGRTYDITAGPREVMGRRRFLEFSATGRAE